jgi:hypothetical protein
MKFLHKHAPTLMGPKMYVPKWLQSINFWMLAAAALSVLWTVGEKVVDLVT